MLEEKLKEAIIASVWNGRTGVGQAFDFTEAATRRGDQPPAPKGGRSGPT